MTNYGIIHVFIVTLYDKNVLHEIFGHAQKNKSFQVYLMI